MKPVDQTVFGDGSDGSEPGNCFAACIASLLELPLSEVPNFATAGPDGAWFRAANEWLNARGFVHIDLRFTEDVTASLPDWFRDGCLPKGFYYIGSGPAARGLQHSVVMCGLDLAHDPHPSRAGLITLNACGLLVPFRPPVAERGPCSHPGCLVHVPTYTFCPTCGEPIETADLDAHVRGCDGSIPATSEMISDYLDDFRAGFERGPVGTEEFSSGVRASIYDRAERRSDKILRDDGSEKP